MAGRSGRGCRPPADNGETPAFGEGRVPREPAWVTPVSRGAGACESVPFGDTCDTCLTVSDCPATAPDSPDQPEIGDGE